MDHLDLILKTMSNESHAELYMLLMGLPVWYFLAYWLDQVRIYDENFRTYFFVFIIFFIPLLLTWDFM